jgi:hypothetical protein
MNVLECFCWAVLNFEGFRPGSKSWRNRNPGNLRPIQRAGHPVQPAKDGYRFFASFSEGWDALLSDVGAKFRGKPYTTSGLGPDSTLLQFFEKYAPSADSNHPETYAKFVADFLTKGLQRPISLETTLREIQSGTIESSVTIDHFGDS